MTFAFKRAQALCREQLRISPLPCQKALIPYAWHLALFSFFTRPTRILGVQSIAINNKSNPLLPQYYLVYYINLATVIKKSGHMTAFRLHPVTLYVILKLLCSIFHNYNHSQRLHTIHQHNMLHFHMNTSDT